VRPGFAIELVPLQPAHVPAAAELVASRYRGLLVDVPALPPGWAEPRALVRILEELVARGSGVAALHEDELVGFQAATLIDGHGGRWSYTPDIGHATAELARGEADRLIERCYARLAAGWVRDACLEHVVTVLAGDAAARLALGRLGFGETVIDLVRDLAPVDAPAALPGLAIRRALPGDADVITDLDQGLREHLAASPVFLRPGPARSAELQRRTLADARTATFVAELDASAVAFLRIGPSATDVATVVRDRGTASITGAFTIPSRRGVDIATCLLAAAVDWARDAGYARIAVDHESANGEGARFWARHCTPVAVSLTRRLAPRTVA
jgi:GNAT superfamily N-acetyltransferase